MAKKSVASLQKGGGKQHSKVIKMVKSPKSGAYSFKEEIVSNQEVNNWFNKKQFLFNLEYHKLLRYGEAFDGFKNT